MDRWWNTYYRGDKSLISLLGFLWHHHIGVFGPLCTAWSGEDMGSHLTFVAWVGWGCSLYSLYCGIGWEMYLLLEFSSCHPFPGPLATESTFWEKGSTCAHWYIHVPAAPIPGLGYWDKKKAQGTCFHVCGEQIMRSLWELDISTAVLNDLQAEFGTAPATEESEKAKGSTAAQLLFLSCLHSKK
jgi:hypothetical protein